MAIYARLENGTYAEVTGVYKTDGTEVTEIFQGDRLVYSAYNELYGSLPLYYDGLGYELIDYLISGNALQDGTPSVDAPVDVIGCGVRMGNLFDKSATNTNNGYISNGYLMSNGNVNVNGGYRASEYIAVSSNQLYALFYGANLNAPSVCFYDSSKNFISGIAYSGRWTLIFTTPQNAVFLRLSFRMVDADKVMLNLGSTALPYEPYGYKLPLTVNGTEYPIYLGEVETTRKIKKLVLTGEENWRSTSGRMYLDALSDDYMRASGVITCICNHYSAQEQVGSASRVNEGCITLGSDSSNQRLYVYDTNISTAADFKTYLQQQYAAGTPVTIWYVLAEPETGIVNEPLMKIGDYADTVSFAQAGVTIPTVSGANILDMASPVKPSEMYIKGKGIKPTGYGQLSDVNGVNVLDKDSKPIYVHGQ